MSTFWSLVDSFVRTTADTQQSQVKKMVMSIQMDDVIVSQGSASPLRDTLKVSIFKKENIRQFTNKTWLFYCHHGNEK